MPIELCSFWTGGRLYGVDLLAVQEIVRPVTITPIAHSPKELLGLINIRGEIRLLLDLAKMTGYGDSQENDESRFILFKNSVGENFGVLADKIGNVIQLDESKISSYEKNLNSSENSELCRGIYKVEDELLMIIEAKNLLELMEAV